MKPAPDAPCRATRFSTSFSTEGELKDLRTSGRDLLRIEGLEVAFPMLRGEFQAVRGASLRILPGRVTALVGESGSGKTVTGQTILGLQSRHARVTGRILFDEELGFDPAAVPGLPAPDDASEYAERKPEGPLDLLTLPRDGRRIRAIRTGRIGMIFQEPMTSFSPLHTIGNQVSEALTLHRMVSPKEARQRCEEMLGRVGFPDPARAFDMYPFELSGGMRQRAMIAMAVICRPSLLIADEPTTALDVTIQAQILGLMRDLQQEMGLAVLLITHDLGVVANIADEVVVMHRGQVMEAGPTAEIFAHPRHPYLKGLMQAIPGFGPRARERLKPLREIPQEGIDELARFRAAAQAAAPRTGGSPTLIRVEGVTKSFLSRSQSWSLFAPRAEPVVAVDDVSFDIRRGECLGLVGESGSGKTTLGKMLVRAIRPERGRILYNDGGREIDIPSAKGADLDLMRIRTQMIFQDPVSSLSPRMTVGSILAEPMEIHDRGNAEERKRKVGVLLNAIGLGEAAATRFPHSFSGGQRQRIGIARALALAPEFIVCDEPVSALDVSVQAQILNLLKDLQSRLGLTYLFVSHNLAVVNYMADRVAVMWRGRLVEIADCDTIMRDPVHPYTRALLAAVPMPDPAHRLDLSAARRPATKAEADWPAAFQEGPGTRLTDLGGGHFVRLREAADARELAS